MYSVRQSSAWTWTSSRVWNCSQARNSSRKRPLNDSQIPLCQGEPGSIVGGIHPRVAAPVSQCPSGQLRAVVHADKLWPPAQVGDQLVEDRDRRVGGEGARRSGGQRSMWARVKGETENAMLALPLQAYMLRPGFIQPLHGARSSTRLYRVVYWVIAPLAPLIRRLWPGQVTTTEQLGMAMLRVARQGAPKRVLERGDIIALVRWPSGASRPRRCWKQPTAGTGRPTCWPTLARGSIWHIRWESRDSFGAPGPGSGTQVTPQGTLAAAAVIDPRPPPPLCLLRTAGAERLATTAEAWLPQILAFTHTGVTARVNRLVDGLGVTADDSYFPASADRLASIGYEGLKGLL